MADDVIGRVGILRRGDRRTAPAPIAANDRLRPLFDALVALNIAPEAVVYADDAAPAVREQLSHLDGVLVWVDPIANGEDRSRLDALLRDVASTGAWVSAHPDVILKMGTKEVVYRTRTLGWGSDTHAYATFDELRERFPVCLAAHGPRVLKQNRGNDGIGVWKVALLSAPNPNDLTRDAIVRVQHAEHRGGATEDVRLDAFLARCQEYFGDGGLLIDQRFEPRIVDGMIRCYMVQDQVAGFAHQSPAEPDAADGPVLGLPSAKAMFAASEPRFAGLKRQMQSEWLPGMQELLDLDRNALPMLWDADFLYGPSTAAGEDTYVLCEINVSSVSPFPEGVPAQLAEAVRARLAG